MNRSKAAVAVALVVAVLLGAPGFPATRAFAQAVTAGAVPVVPGGAGVAASGAMVPLGIGASGSMPLSTLQPGLGVGLPGSAVTLTPGITALPAVNGGTAATSAGTRALAPATQAARTNSLATLRPLAPANGLRQTENAGTALTAPAPNEARPMLTSRGVLETMHRRLSRGEASGNARSVSALDMGFDARRAQDDAPVAAPVRASDAASPWRLLPAGTLAVAAVAAPVVPLPAVTSPVLQSLQTAAPSASAMPGEAGAVALIGLAVVGLGLFLFNAYQAATGWRDLQRLEKRHQDFNRARELQARYAPELESNMGARASTIERTADERWELVLYFDDAKNLERAKTVKMKVEDLPVRVEALTAENVSRLISRIGEDTSTPAPKFSSLKRNLLKAVAISAVAAAVLLAAASLVAAPAGAMSLAALPLMTASQSSFAWGMFWVFFLVSGFIFDRSFPAALLLGVIAGFGHPWIAFLVGMFLTSAESTSKKRS